MRNCNDNILIGIKILRVYVTLCKFYLCPSCIGILGLKLCQLILYYAILQSCVGEHLLQIGNPLHKLIKLILKLLTLQARKLAQSHLHNGICLKLCKAESLHKPPLGLIYGRAGADNLNHLIYKVQSLEQTLKYMRPCLCLCKFKFGSSYYNLVPVLYKIVNQLLKVEKPWTAIYQSNIIYREAGLQRGIFIERVENHICRRAHLKLYYNAHTLPVALIINIGYAFNALILNQFCHF